VANAQGTWAITRRSLLAAPLALATTAQTHESGLEQDVATFVSFGEHRAGTAVEARTARWLTARLAGHGYRVEQQKVPIRTLLNPGGHLRVAERRIALFPQWLPPEAALTQPVKAPILALGAEAGPASIRVLTSPASLSANWIEPFDALVREAAGKGATALVMAINDPADDLFVCNQHHKQPFPIPVALVARRDLPAAVASIGTPGELTLTGRMAQAKAINIWARKPGKGRLIVISTPLTGWFWCGAERGPGIALWLKMAAALMQQERPVLMLGTGSHEIGHLGMEHALAHGAPAPDAVDLWIHFGASLAATRLDQRYGYTSGQFLVGTDETGAMAREALGSVMPVYVPGTARTLGEAGQVIGAGHRRFIGMSGQFPTFHTPLDRGEAIDFARLERIAAQTAALIARLA
jgi:hypothetical protein